MELTEHIIFIGALLLIASILASQISSRLGTPLLLVFLVLGMLAGENGPGHIQFNNFQAANLIGNIALAVILFDGGLRTHYSDFRVGLKPALSLATLGVLVSAGITGLFAAWLLHLHWLQGLLIGALVASTDAAAVFSLMQQSRLELKQRVAATLEIESGSNDPMAVFLTITLVELLASNQPVLSWHLPQTFLQQMGLGALAGIGGGWLLAWLINRIDLQASLYPLLAVAGGTLIFAGTSLLGGSGFLAIYLIGLVVGNRPLQAKQTILRMNSGFAWLAQIGMFLMLGLLVTPRALVPVIHPALLIALMLILVARPFAVWLSLLPFRFPWRDQLFISWVGLRGAVPIVLATFPLLARLPQADLYFNVIFFVVLVSLVLQGWTMAFAARRLGVEVPPKPMPNRMVDVKLSEAGIYEIVSYRLSPDSLAVNQPLRQIPLPEGALISGVLHNDRLVSNHDVETLKPGDEVFLMAPADHLDALNMLFAASAAPPRLETHTFFGDFVLNGDARIEEVSTLYGFPVADRDKPLTLAEYMMRAFKGRAVVGDRVALRAVDLVVREMSGKDITKVGIKFRANPGEI